MSLRVPTGYARSWKMGIFMTIYAPLCDHAIRLAWLTTRLKPTMPGFCRFHKTATNAPRNMQLLHEIRIFAQFFHE